MPDYKHHIRQHSTWSRLLFKSVDAIAIGVGLWCVLRWNPELDSSSTIVVTLTAIGVFSLVAEFLGLYRNWQAIAFAREVTCSLTVWAATLGILSLLGKFSVSSTELSGPSLITWFAFTPVYSLSARIFLRWIMVWRVRRGINARRYAIVGANELGIRLAENINGSPDLALQLLGFYDDRPEARTVSLPGDLSRRLGSVDDLVRSAQLGDVNVIFITLPLRAESRVRHVIERLSDSTVSVYLVPDLFVFQLLHSRWTDIRGVPVVSVFENPFYGVDGVLKRSVDLALAAILLVIAALPMLIIAAAIKFTSAGPILYRQQRYGLDGKRIQVWKFRSMNVCENAVQVIQASADDSRVTRLGAILRRTSLDELPQLFNVLAGTMSLVGPRPHATAHNEFYRSQIEGYMLRHKVKPGMTGLAQVNGCRGETETIEKMQRRIEFDHVYIREWSLWLDLRILLQTCKVVVTGDNAY